MLNKVFTRVDFPRPDSPNGDISFHNTFSLHSASHTNNHHIEVEALADTLAVPLVGQVGETDVACQLAADHVLHVGGSLGGGLGVAGGDRLGNSGAHWVAALDERRFHAAARGGRVPGRDRRRDWGSRRRRSFRRHQYVVVRSNSQVTYTLCREGRARKSN